MGHSEHMAIPTQLWSPNSEVVSHSGLCKFTVVHFVSKCYTKGIRRKERGHNACGCRKVPTMSQVVSYTVNLLYLGPNIGCQSWFLTRSHLILVPNFPVPHSGDCKNPISATCTWDNIISVITYNPWFMTIGKDQNKDRFKNWQLCSVWKLPFCDHRAILPIHVSISSLHLLSLVNTTPSYLSLSPDAVYCHSLAAYTALVCKERYFWCWFSFRFSRTQQINDRVHAEDLVEKMLAAPNCLQKYMVEPAALNADTPVDSAVTVYPIHVDYEKEWRQHTPLLET